MAASEANEVEVLEDEIEVLNDMDVSEEEKPLLFFYKLTYYTSLANS